MQSFVKLERNIMCLQICVSYNGKSSVSQDKLQIPASVHSFFNLSPHKLYEIALSGVHNCLPFKKWQLHFGTICCYLVPADVYLQNWFCTYVFIT